jgi:hypothetical protein
MVVAGKEGKLYVLDRDRLGKYQDASDSEIVRSIKVPAAYGAVACWNGHIFYADCCGFVTHDCLMKNGLLEAGPITGRMSSIGGIPSVSSDGAKMGFCGLSRRKNGMNSRSISLLYCMHTKQRTSRMNSITVSSWSHVTGLV